LPSAVDVRGNKSGRSGDYKGRESGEGSARARRDGVESRSSVGDGASSVRVRSRPVIKKGKQGSRGVCVVGAPQPWLEGPMHHVIIKPGPLVGCPL
jgi:hypothetical protein